MQRPVRLLLLALLLGSAAVAQEGVDNSVVGEPDGGNPLLSSEGSVSERVTKFYELYLPAKVPALKKIFFRYKATGGDEKLLADLKSKYGGKTRSQIQIEQKEAEREARSLEESLRQAKIDNEDEGLPDEEGGEADGEEGQDFDPEAEEEYPEDLDMMDEEDEGGEQDENAEPEDDDQWWGDLEPTETIEDGKQSDLDRMMEDFYAYVDHISMDFGVSPEALVDLSAAEKGQAVEQRTLAVQQLVEQATELYPDTNFDEPAGENFSDEPSDDPAEKLMHHLNELFYGFKKKEQTQELLDFLDKLFPGVVQKWREMVGEMDVEEGDAAEAASAEEDVFPAEPEEEGPDATDKEDL